MYVTAKFRTAFSKNDETVTLPHALSYQRSHFLPVHSFSSLCSSSRSSLRQRSTSVERQPSMRRRVHTSKHSSNCSSNGADPRQTSMHNWNKIHLQERGTCWDLLQCSAYHWTVGTTKLFQCSFYFSFKRCTEVNWLSGTITLIGRIQKYCNWNATFTSFNSNCAFCNWWLWTCDKSCFGYLFGSNVCGFLELKKVNFGSLRAYHCWDDRTISVLVYI